MSWFMIQHNWLKIDSALSKHSENWMGFKNLAEIQKKNNEV